MVALWSNKMNLLQALLAVMLVVYIEFWHSAIVEARECKSTTGAGGQCTDKSIDKFDSWINLLRLRNLEIRNATSFSFVGNTRSNDSSRYLTIQEFMGFLGDPSNWILRRYLML